MLRYKHTNRVNHIKSLLNVLRIHDFKLDGQQDAAEFFSKLCEHIEKKLAEHDHLKDIYPKIFRGQKHIVVDCFNINMKKVISEDFE